MRLAIVGSTSLAGNVEAQRIIERVFHLYEPMVLISGGADGIDSMAENWANMLGIPVDIRRPVHATWTHPEGGYKERNLEIAASCDRLVRIVVPDSKTYGSGWTRDRAKELGKPTEEYVVVS